MFRKVKFFSKKKKKEKKLEEKSSRKKEPKIPSRKKILTAEGWRRKKTAAITHK